MKLNIILEANPTRRDFLRQTAAVAVGNKSIFQLLMNMGVGSGAAQAMAAAPKWFLRSDVANNPYTRTADDDYNEFIDGVRHLEKLSQSREMLIGNGFESIAGIVELSPQAVARLLATGTKLNDDNEDVDVIELELEDGSNIWLSTHLPSICDGETFEELTNPVKQWWENWGSSHPVPLSRKLFQFLTNNGIDPTKRQDWVYDSLADFYVRGEFDSPELYGLTPEHIQQAIKRKNDYDLDSWGSLDKGPPANIEKYDNHNPDYHIYGSSMHQPMESYQKLLKKLSLSI